MIFSSKAEYGVRLMVELGRQAPEQPVSLKAIADAEGLPLAYLEQVVAKLRRGRPGDECPRGTRRLLARAARGGDHDVSRSSRRSRARSRRWSASSTIRSHRVLCSHQPDAGRGCATKLLWTRVQGGIIRSLQTITLAELVEFSAQRRRRRRSTHS